MPENSDEKLQREADQKIRDLAEHYGVSQIGLSIKIGLAGNTIPNYLTKKRIPAEFVCLLLAGISERPEDREFWIGASGLDAKQLHIIRTGLGIQASSAEEMGEIADLIDNPQDNRERAVADLVRVTVQNRIELRGEKR